ncbi:MULTISPECIES: DUF6745 domain-containing protein [Nostocales]|uniref:DUF6745 domain-containing protein n=3 Tax=Nostocales TaxID=1161 RepID=A0A8S9SXI9_9CYAN|nr:hypothetical protein [Tolypothrix bouteillei]KAF3884457.1 hypothetical protein DA73_0400002465 [Tolypothrix bouteillei VB521301]
MSRTRRPTVEQLALISSYIEKWRAIATNTNRLDSVKVTAIIHEIYQLLNVNAPLLKFTDSPYSAGLILKEFIESRNYAPLNNLSQPIQKHLKEELTFQLTGYSDVKVYPVQLIEKEKSNHILNSHLYHQFHCLLAAKVRTQLWKQPQVWTTLKTQSWYYDYCYIAPEWWACDGCYLDWLSNCLNWKHNPKYWELFEALIIECGWIFPFTEICIVCERPIRISFDTEKRLHAEAEPALEFLDGFRVYAHHGVTLPEQYGILFPNQWKAQWYREEKLASVKEVLLQNLPVHLIEQNWLLSESDTNLKRLLVQRLGIEVKTLTNAQTNILSDYHKKWREVALQLAPINRQKAALAIEQFYTANNSPYTPEILFADGLYIAQRLVKQKCRGQISIIKLYSYYGHKYGREYLNLALINKLWSTIAVQLSDSVLQELRNVLICKRSWSLEPYFGWIKSEELTGWCSLFDFCISILGCVHDQNLWSILQAVVTECGWFFPCQRTCIVCERPIKLSVDDRDRLHAENEPAIVYADGYKLRARHGLHPKKYFQTY